MPVRSNLHRTVSILLTIALLAQFITPVLALPQSRSAASGSIPGNEAQTSPPLSKLALLQEPSALTHPISIARVQSSYQAGENITIIYIVTNNQLPTQKPDLAGSTTVTDSVGVLAAFDPAEDAGTIRALTLETTLTAAAFVASSLSPVQNGGTLNWTIDDLPPMASQTITVTIQPPSAAPDFTELDTGMTVSGMLWDMPVSQTARPAILAPDSVSSTYLESTLDADAHDKDMLWKAAEYGQDPLELFAFVQGVVYEPYKGSLRGTRGTLWGQAGNSIDQSSLLIAMLRAAGVPARYRHGTLDTAAAQNLINSMFPTPQGVAGYLPTGTDLADPANDPDLIALAQDHWWVEAYLPGSGWTDMDSAFANAAVGDTFHTSTASDGTDRAPELPDSVRHTVTFSLIVEKYSQFPVSGSFLSQSVPLSATLPTAQIAGKRVVLSQFVTDNSNVGFVFATREITYQPYFSIQENNQAFLGDPFQDVLSSFPLGTAATTAIWLEYEVSAPDGSSESYQRPVKDLLGPDARMFGGTPDLAFDLEGPPFLTPDEQYVSWVLPNDVPEWAYRRRTAALMPVLVDLGRQSEATLEIAGTIGDDDPNAEQLDVLMETMGTYTRATAERLSLTGLRFAQQTDQLIGDIESGLHARLYYSSPRLFAVGASLGVSATQQVNVDLRTTRANVVVAPGQSSRAAQTAQWLKGVIESQLEGDTLSQVFGAPALSTARLFTAMADAGVDPVLIQPDEIHLLDLYPFSAEGKAHMTAALTAGNALLVPSQPIMLDGEPALTWWQIDPATGETISVGEDGLHIAALTYRIIEDLAETLIIAIFEFVLNELLKWASGGNVDTGTSGVGIAALAEMLMDVGESLSDMFFAVAAAFGPAASAPLASHSSWAFLPAHLCPVDNCGVEQFFLDDTAFSPIPLPQMLFGYSENDQANPIDIASLEVDATLPSGTPQFTLSAVSASSSTLPESSVQFQAQISSNFDDTFRTIVYAPENWIVDVDTAGNISAQPLESAAPGDHTILVVAQSNLYPEMAVSAIHTITVTAVSALDLTYTAEPNITIPAGVAQFTDVSNQTSDGETELPDSAFQLVVANFSGESKAITLTVSGAPAGWLVLNGSQQESASFEMDGSSRSRVGLYVVPPTLPAPGTTFEMQVQLSDDSGVSDSVTIPWTMPGQPFNYLEASPDTLFLAPNGSADITLTTTNVGSAAASFPITATAAISTWVFSPLQAPVTLAAGESGVQTTTLTIGDATPGRVYPIQFASPALDSYTQYAFADVRVVTPESGIIFEAADSCNLGSDAISASLETLALAVVELEEWCGLGSCPLPLRDNVVAAAESAAVYAGLAANGLTTPDSLSSAASAMSSHTENIDIAADISAISDAVSLMETELCQVEKHLPAAAFTPYLDAVLLGESNIFTLTVTNQGSLTTTFDITTTLPDGISSFSRTLAPGAAIQEPIATTPASLGSYTLQADVVPTGTEVKLPITATATARLNVVEQFVQVTAVTADPDFVDTGSSATDLSVSVANLAGVSQSYTVRTTILDASGGLSYTSDIPLTTLIGTPRTYPLAAVDTSNWAAGLYTVTVDLIGPDTDILPGGSGYGYFSVGQSVVASQALQPSLVSPGNVTVTTILTTAIQGQTLASQGAGSPALLQPTDLLSESPLAPEPMEPQLIASAESSAPETRPAPAASLSVSGVYTRTEQDDPAVGYSGSWASWPLNRASGSSYAYSGTPGSTAAFTFTGSLVTVGFIASSAGGQAEIFIDGSSAGIVDLFRREQNFLSQEKIPLSFTYDGLLSASHVISVTVLGTADPESSNDYVQLDYIDFWDGDPLPDGTFEQDDTRIIRSGGWSSVNIADASGGSYYRSSSATAWFPFSGSSFDYTALAYSGAGEAHLYLDGEFLAEIDLFSWTPISRTFAFTGLASGPHLLQVTSYRELTTLDTFATPASQSPEPPPVIGDFHRFEEDDPALLYNGLPFTRTARSWAPGYNDVVSGHFFNYSSTPTDTVQLTFSGTSVGVGFYAETRAGQAEIFIDGLSQGVVDTYRRDPTTMSLYFPDLSAGSHTISVTVLGQNNPAASADNVYLDYFDVWNGTPLPDGTFEEMDSRLYRSFRWDLQSNAEASGDQYLQDAITPQANGWFPFTGDSVTFRAIAGRQGSETTKVLLDGQPLAAVNLYSYTTVSRTFSFDGLGDGVHVLQLEKYRGELTVDAFTTPGTLPFTQTPVYTGVVRYEEDDPALRYRSDAVPEEQPYGARPQSWSQQYQSIASGGYSGLSTTANDQVSLTFDGRWLSIGFFTHVYGGQAEIFVDGVTQGTIGLYTASPDVASFTIGDLITGTHTVSVTVLGIPDSPSTQSRVHLDYIDVWDGQAMPDDIANASMVSPNGRVHFSASLDTYDHPNAQDGDYVASIYDSNVWYSFTGDDFTFYGLTDDAGTHLADVYVDGQFIETADLLYPFTEQPMPYRYSGFGDGPHVVRINNNANFRVDAFGSNQPLEAYRPTAEWWESSQSGGASIWGGVHVPAAVGDVTGDGKVEVVVAASNTANNGELFLMRGDGADTGDGDPIIWSVPFNIPNGFEDVGAPAIAQLDGQPGAEIVIANSLGVYAFHSDGSTYWFTDTLKPNIMFGTPSIGNLDLDPEPEIVINLGQTLAVFEQDGTIAWQQPHIDGMAVPLLADLTGDGLLDILVHDWSNTLYLYDYNLGTPSLVWTTVFTDQLHGYGAPAVADLDQDGQPEVAIASENWLYTLNGDDGSVSWSAPLGAGRSGGVTIADIDGDGAMELVTSSQFNGGTLYAFEADGTPKWTAAGLDSSPLNTSAADIDGDGAAELLWNGNPQGFTIYDGRTGAILFNEPAVVSATGTDVPVAADVDLDGYLEIVVPAQGGIRVFGFDGVWGPARPLWNQLNYHISSINDDLTVPFNEPNSWDSHNSYRAQTELLTPSPSYSVLLTYTTAVTGVSVLTDTFSTLPLMTPPTYRWDYNQTWTQPIYTTTFDSALTGMQPGEVRQVSEGVEGSYTLRSGSSQFRLPPLYLQAAHILALSTPTQTVPAGATVTFDLVLTNPDLASGASYTVTVSGIPAAWISYPALVNLAAGETQTVTLTITIPADALPGEQPFFVDVTTGSGGTDSVQAGVQIIDGIEVAVTPSWQSSTAASPVTYTVTISNLESTAQSYTLSGSGLAVVELPNSPLLIAGGSAQTIIITATAYNEGPHPFTVAAAAGSSGASGQADAVVEAAGSQSAALALSPSTAVGGLGSPASYTLTLTNLGGLPDSYDLSLDLPAGWSYQLNHNGAAVTTLSLNPFVLNSAELLLLVTPDSSAVPGDYQFTVTAASTTNPGKTAVTTGTLQLLDRGVQLQIQPGSITTAPTGTVTWQVLITNTGATAETYDLSAGGIAAAAVQFSPASVALDPGQSTTVQMSASSIDYLLPGTYQVAVAAQSQDRLIQNEEIADLTITGYEAVEIGWLPPARTVTDTLSAAFILVITNTSNISATYQLELDAPALSSSFVSRPQLMLPHTTASIPVTVHAAAPGTYTLTASASSTTSAASDSAAAALHINESRSYLYLPVIVQP